MMKKIVGAAVISLAASGCFAQSGAMAESCDQLRKVWSEAQAEMQTVVRDGSLAPQAKAERLTATADELRQESQSIQDEQLRGAMNAVAGDIKKLAESLGAAGSGRLVAPPPPATSFQNLTKAMDDRCPA